MSMSCLRKSSSLSHSGSSLACLLRNACLISESRGISGYILASESMNILALCLLSTVFIAAIAPILASVRITRLVPSLSRILSLVLLTVSIGTSGLSFFGSIWKPFSVPLSSISMPAASVNTTFAALKRPPRRATASESPFAEFIADTLIPSPFNAMFP